MFVNNELPPENVFGHTKKVDLIRNKMEELSRDLGRGLKVLDVGCGNGSAVTRYLRHNGGDVLGLDFHEPSIEYAQRNYSGDGLRFQVRRVEDLWIDDERFDVVVLADVLEHLGAPDELLKKVSLLMNDSGRIYVTIPNGFGPFEIESFIARIPLVGKVLIKATDYFIAFLNKCVFIGAWCKELDDQNIPYNEESPHIQFFTKKRFTEIARESGLVVEEWRNLSWLSGPFTNYLFSPSHSFCKFNLWAADILPHFMVSAWFIELRKV